MASSDSPTTNEQIYQVLVSVPKGKVVTYGQVAELCGMGRGARVVARALRTLPTGSKIPWFRVINSQGRISIPSDAGAQRQQAHLESEGVVFLSGKVDLRKYQWRP